MLDTIVSFTGWLLIEGFPYIHLGILGGMAEAYLHYSLSKEVTHV